MHITLDYLLTTFLIITLLTISISTVYVISFNPISYNKGSQLREIAERTLDKILLTDGYPPNWGSDFHITSENLSDFGLHLQNASMYVLDSDKVSRLHPGINETLRMDPMKVAELLGLSENGILKYGFSLRIKPYLNITIQDVGTDYFKITVRKYDGSIAAGARVKAIYIIANINETSGRISNITWGFNYLETNIQGICYLNLSSLSTEESQYFCLIIYADYLQFESATIHVASSTTNDTKVAPGLQLQASRGHLTPLIAGEWGSGYFVAITSDSITAVQITKPSGGLANFTLYDAGLDPNTQFIIAVLNKGSGEANFYVLSGSRPLCTSQSPVIFETSEPGGFEVCSITRYVTINDLTYVVEFYIWPMSSA